MKKFLLSFLILIAFAGFAFSCPQTESGVPACAYFTRADAVFSGKVLKVENAGKSEDLPDGSRKVRFQVLQNFKGADNPTFSLFTAGAGIKAGQTWIVYASNDIVVKSFAEFHSVRIEPKDPPSAELEMLKNILAGKTETAISGQLNSNLPDKKYSGEPVEITIEGGGKRLTAKTDASGAFNIPVPPDAKYKVELKFPFNAGLKWADGLLGTSYAPGIPTLFKYEVKLNDGDCNFSFFEVSDLSNKNQ